MEWCWNEFKEAKRVVVIVIVVCISSSTASSSSTSPPAYTHVLFRYGGTNERNKLT